MNNWPKYRVALYSGQYLLPDILSILLTMIRIFSTPTCPYCVTLKEFLKQHGFEFEDINVAVNDQAREEMIQKSQQMGVPVIEIDGQIIIGFDKKRIVQLLNIKE